jgi:serine/threonine protein kinase
MYDLPLPGTIVAGKYRVETLLGEGGMSTVFRAHHELMDKAVALKWLRPELSARPEAKDRFLREARASARLKHPNVVEVYDVGVHQGALFLVMELLQGESFASLIQHGEISIPSAIRLLLGAMEGVATAHESGIVHRDIKPENIFVVRNRTYPDGIAKILDFGISKLTDEQGSGSLTRTGHTVGTPEYMSMEQMTGQPDVDGRADVYSFGVLLYRALTGQSPFSGQTFAAIAVEVATATPIPPRALRPDLPASLEYVVLKAMARHREDRYPSIRDLIDALSFLGSTQGFLSQMPPGSSGGAPQLTPTPQGLRDLVPVAGFNAETVALAPPPAKALSDHQLSVRTRAPRKRRSFNLLLGLVLVGAAGLVAVQLWLAGEAPTADADPADDPGNLPQEPEQARDPVGSAQELGSAGQALRDQDRPLAQPPQDPSANDGWDSHGRGRGGRRSRLGLRGPRRAAKGGLAALRAGTAGAPYAPASLAAPHAAHARASGGARSRDNASTAPRDDERARTQERHRPALRDLAARRFLERQSRALVGLWDDGSPIRCGMRSVAPAWVVALRPGTPPTLLP